LYLFVSEVFRRYLRRYLSDFKNFKSIVQIYGSVLQICEDGLFWRKGTSWKFGSTSSSHGSKEVINLASLDGFFFTLVVGRILFDPCTEILTRWGYRMFLTNDSSPRIVHSHSASFAQLVEPPFLLPLLIFLFSLWTICRPPWLFLVTHTMFAKSVQ